MNKIFTLVLLVFIINLTAYSPNHISLIKGIVQTGDNELLEDADILVIGENIGTTTDKHGKYYLQIPNDENKVKKKIHKYLIEASFLGFEKQRRTVEIRNDECIEINFILKEDIYNLDEVTVTASIEKRYLKDVTTKVEVRNIENNGASAYDVTGIVEEFSGVVVEPNGYSRGVVKLNGLPSDYSLILLDGERLKGGHGGIDISQIPLNSIDRVEVVKGPASSLYGSDAIAGVVNIITKEPTERPEISATYELSSFYTNIYKLSSGMKYNDFGLKIDGSLLDTEGETIPQGYISKNLFLKSTYENNKMKFKLSYNYFNEDRNIFYMKEQKNSFKGEAHYNINKFDGITASLYWIKYDRSTVSGGEIKESLENDLSAKIHYNNYLWNKNLLILGFEYLKRDIDNYYIVGDNNTYSSFLQYDYVINTVTITAGSRLDYYEKWGYQFSPKLNLMHSFKNLKVRASVGTGFKAPTLDQLYSFWYLAAANIWIEGNKDLVPEESIGYNMSLDYELSDNISTDLDIYYNDIEGLISSYQVGYIDGKRHYSYKNYGDLDTYGGSFNITTKMFDYLDFSSKYSYTTTTDTLFLPNNPKHKISFAANLSDITLIENTINSSVGLKLNYRGEAFSDIDNTEKISNFQTVDFSSNFIFYDSFNFGFHILNLLDEKYAIYDDMPGRTYRMNFSIYY